VKNYLGADEVELASDEIIMKATGSPSGFVGPVNINISDSSGLFGN